MCAVVAQSSFGYFMYCLCKKIIFATEVLCKVKNFLNGPVSHIFTNIALHFQL